MPDTMMRVKNWKSFQHYSKRNPPWIKLHKCLLDNFEFQCLPLASKALAPMLWLIASEDKEGYFDGAIDKLAFRLRLASSEVECGLIPLIENGFIELASKVLAHSQQSATPEAERETEKPPLVLVGNEKNGNPDKTVGELSDVEEAFYG